MATATNAALGSVKLAGDLQAGDALNPALVPSGVVPGEYPTIYKIHVDSKGRTVWVSGEPEEVKEDVPLASTTVVGSVKPGHNINYANNTIDVNKTSSVLLGIAKLGAGLEQNELTGATDVVLPDASTTVYGKAKGNQEAIVVDGSGFIKVDPNGYCTEIGPATTSSLGFIKTGAGLNISSGEYLDAVVWPARTDVYGGIKLGEGFTLDDGFLETFKATNSLPGVVMNPLNSFYLDPESRIYLHTAHYGLYGYLQGISGPDLYLDNGTHTLSATYLFSNFPDTASSSVFGKVQIGDNISVSTGVISVPTAVVDGTPGVIKVSGRIFKVIGNELICDHTYPASTVYNGCVKPDGTTVTFSDLPNSVISVDLSSSYNIATTLKKGAVQIGAGLSVSSGVVSIPDATTTSLGLVQIGDGLTVINGVLSIDNLLIASSTNYGIVRLSPEIAYDDLEGNLDYSIISFNAATTEKPGGVKVLNNGGPIGLHFWNSEDDGTDYVAELYYNTSYIANGEFAGVVKSPGGIFDSAVCTSGVPGTVYVPTTPEVQLVNDTVNLTFASTTAPGVIKGNIFSSGCGVGNDGVFKISTTTTSNLGSMQVGSGLNVELDGQISIASEYVNIHESNIFNKASIHKPKIWPSYMPINYPGVNILFANDDDLFLNSDVQTLILFNPTTVNVSEIDLIFIPWNNENLPAQNIEQDIKLVYPIVNKIGTSIPVQISFDGQSCGTGVYGDTILITVKQLLVGNTRMFKLKSAEIFKN